MTGTPRTRSWTWCGWVVGVLAMTAPLAHAGCAPARPWDNLPGDLSEAVRRADPVVDAPAEPAPVAGQLVAPSDAEVQAALTAWKETGQAPIIKSEDFIQYPYGLTEAVLTCQPLRVCDIELEAGEEILNVSLGDSSRWLASPAFSGDRDALTPHVLVKPTEPGIATNAIVTTSRRTYYLALVAPAKAGAIPARRVKFYYPQDFGSPAKGGARAKDDTTVARLARVAVESLNFDYRIEGGDVPWKPLRVFDDGTHVFIQMPDAMRVTDAPAVFVQSRTGDTALVNYRLRNRYYIVDKLFDTAVLVVGAGSQQQRITIRRGGALR